MAEQKATASDTIDFDYDTEVNEVGNSYEVGDLRDSDADAGDWMSKLLLNKEFQMLSAGNLQAIFAKLEPIQMKAGQHVIEQDDSGDYFYILTAGACVVTRKLPLDKGDMILAELKVGDTFGEEALITDAKRQASITMVTDGQVMRLSKEDFQELLSGPIVTYVDSEEASQLISDGACWLEVGMSASNDQNQYPDAIHVPMYMLRLKLDLLDSDKHCVIVCDEITHSAAAAHILRQYGYDASVLKTDE